MKKLSAPFAILILLITAAFSAKDYTIDSVRGSMIEFQFRTPSRWSSPDNFPDTTISISTTVNDRVYKEYAMKMCGTTPSYMYYSMYISLDSNAYWNYTSFSYDKDFRDRFKKLFGEDIIASSFKTVSNDAQDNIPSEFRFYNPKGLEAAFNKLYLPPSANYKGLSLQKIYNISLKEYIRDIGRTLTGIMKNRQIFEEMAAGYLSKAKTDKEFNGQTYSYEVAAQLLGNDNIKYQCFDELGPVRIVSIALRRQCDGSLPAVIKLYKKLVKDYDPEYFEEIKSNF